MTPSISYKKVSIGLPWGIGTVELQIDDKQREAAWELYVELVTRIAVQPLDPNHGLMREALNSLYSLFDITRGILRKHGRELGRDEHSVGWVMIAALNVGVRKFTANWHPLLANYEEKRSPDKSKVEWERAWEHNTDMREALKELQLELRQYAIALGKVAEIKAELAFDLPELEITKK